MELSFGSRIKHAWNAFRNKEPTSSYNDYSLGSYYRPDRVRLTRGNERSIVTAVLNRVALDVSAIEIKHCRLDDNDRFMEVINSGLNNCLTLEANLDQTGRAFKQDITLSMFDEGCVALVPVDTTTNPNITGSYDIESMRTGRIIAWYPNHVKVSVYNENTGKKEDIILSKSVVGIVENPLFAVMNEPNSTLQRLMRKLVLLDSVDEQASSGKLDLIIQLPYVVKSEARKQQANQRREDIERQLSGSRYGIAYTDGTEKITQLNRPVENNLMKQIEYLTSMLYSQLGITQSILDGTADEATMLNYYSRTIEPIVSAIADEMKRKFLTKTARSQKQTILFFRDPFKLVPVKDLAELADKFTRNEIMSSNEMRQVIGLKPSADPKADQLINSNIAQPNGGVMDSQQVGFEGPSQDLSDLDTFDSELDSLEQMLNHSDDSEDSLAHYASKYYDPVKAHEYYERTKELKGRTSTARLNDAGKAAAKNVKDNLSTERKGLVEAEKQAKDSKIEAKKAEIQNKIDVIRKRLEGMTAKSKSLVREKIQKEIDGLREENNAFRLELNEGFKQTRTNLKTEYDNKYASELEQIRNNPAFQKVNKGRGRKSKY